MQRREFLLAATGTAAGATTVVSTPANAQESPDFGGWLDGVDGGFEDARGADTVTVDVGADGNNGAFAFSPAGLWIDPGTTVTWEWTGAGGQHNVNAQDGAEFESELTEEEGFTFEYTFEEEGISTYQCDPHSSLGMKGAVAVGDDVPTTGGGGGDGGGDGDGGGGDGHGGGGEVDPEHMGVPFHAHWVGVATILAIFISFVFTFFQLKYGETPHSGYPRED